VITRLLPPRISVEEAISRFQRKRWSNLFGKLTPRPAKIDEKGNPSSIEMVWIPVHAFEFSLSHAGKQVKSWVTVDATYGGFALFGRRGELVERMPDEESFPPALERAQAEELAREGVVRYILRKRGAKPTVDDITDHLMFYTPVWVYYFRAARGKLNLAVQDAYTGDPMGSQVKGVVLDGFIARRRGSSAIVDSENS